MKGLYSLTSWVSYVGSMEGSDHCTDEETEGPGRTVTCLTRSFRHCAGTRARSGCPGGSEGGTRKETGAAGTRVLYGASSRSVTICLLGYFRLPEAPRLAPHPAQSREQSLGGDCKLSSGLWVSLWGHSFRRAEQYWNHKCCFMGAFLFFIFVLGSCSSGWCQG